MGAIQAEGVIPIRGRRVWRRVIGAGPLTQLITTHPHREANGENLHKPGAPGRGW